MQSNLFFTLLYLLFPTYVLAQSPQLKTTYYPKSKQVKERYWVVKKKKQWIKQGEYLTYFATGELKTKGAFEQGRKTGRWEVYQKPNELYQVQYYKQSKPIGIWETISKQGAIIKRHDYDHNKEIEPTVHLQQLLAHYPPKARAEGVEGTTRIHISFDEGCDVKLSLMTTVGGGLEEAVISTYETYFTLLRNYPPMDSICQVGDTTIVVHFKLE